LIDDEALAYLFRSWMKLSSSSSSAAATTTTATTTTTSSSSLLIYLRPRIARRVIDDEALRVARRAASKIAQGTGLHGRHCVSDE